MSRPGQPLRALPTGVTRILFVRNLPYKITAEEIYGIFGRYGALRQVRVGTTTETKGTAFIVYEDIYDAAAACEHLSGFSVGGRYLVVHYYAQAAAAAAQRAAGVDLAAEQAEVQALRARVAANEASGGGGGGGEELDEEAERRRVSRLRG